MTTLTDGRTVLSHAEWEAEARLRFGEDPRDWAFQCVACKNVQSIASVTARNPSIEPKQAVVWICFGCEGRHTDGVGCDWSLGGLLQIHEVVVDHDGVLVPVFEFASTSRTLA